MQEKILDISEFYDSKYDGYVIKTNKQEIKLLISNYQECCENFGYMTTEDDLGRFIGSNYLGIETVDSDLQVSKCVGFYGQEYNGLFINVQTSLGTLQFVLYNIHNGYYGHTFKVISDSLNLEKVM